jgi:hypothetical protein
MMRHAANTGDLQMNSAAEQIRAWAARAQAASAAADALADDVAALRATARDASGAVTVTVDAAGALLGLDLGDGVRALSPDRLAASIMTTVRSARQGVLDQLATVVDATVGADSPTGAAVLELQERRLRESR